MDIAGCEKPSRRDDQLLQNLRHAGGLFEHQGAIGSHRERTIAETTGGKMVFRNSRTG